jgi:hypothetical protein
MRGYSQMNILILTLNNSPQGAKPIAAVLGCDFRELLI